MNFKKTLVVIALAALALPMSAGAVTTSGRSNADLSELIKSLQEQIKNLQGQQMSLRVDVGPANASTNVRFTRALEEGATGDDVMALQAVLAADATVYPEAVITGVFGPLTKKAVERFQMKHGLEAAGRVGPKTLAVLSTQLELTPIAFESSDNLVPDSWDDVIDDSDDSDDTDDNDVPGRGHGKKLCARIAPGHLIAPGWLKRNGMPIIPECQKLPPGIAKILSGRSTSTATSTATTSRDRTAPRIRNIEAEATDDSVEITWTTNEAATSKVYYSTTTTVTTSSPSVNSSTLVTSHSVSISSLEDETEYSFMVESKDAAGNTSRSTVRSFETED